MTSEILINLLGSLLCGAVLAALFIDEKSYLNWLFAILDNIAESRIVSDFFNAIERFLSGR